MIPECAQLLDRAEKELRGADHMVYITYPLIKDNRILKSVLDQMHNIAENIVHSVLNYEFRYMRIGPITITKLDVSGQNWSTFMKCYSRFNMSAEEITKLREMLEIIARHQSSAVEFTRKDRLVFMSNGAHAESVGFDQMKAYMNNLKAILKKAKDKICAPESSPESAPDGAQSAPSPRPVAPDKLSETFFRVFNPFRR
ncbi:MAG: hypothetical protein WC475_04945 [Candidatus Paceibacterota bacterium]